MVSNFVPSTVTWRWINSKDEAIHTFQCRSNTFHVTKFFLITSLAIRNLSHEHMKNLECKSREKQIKIFSRPMTIATLISSRQPSLPNASIFFNMSWKDKTFHSLFLYRRFLFPLVAFTVLISGWDSVIGTSLDNSDSHLREHKRLSLVLLFWS